MNNYLCKLLILFALAVPLSCTTTAPEKKPLTIATPLFNKPADAPQKVLLPKPYSLKGITKKGDGGSNEKLVSMNFSGASLKTVVEMLSASGKSFAYTLRPEAAKIKVQGLAIENVTRKDALRLLEKLYRLKVERNAGMTIISTQHEYLKALKADTKLAELEMKNSQIKQKTLSSQLARKKMKREQAWDIRTYKIKYARPDEVVEYLHRIYSVVRERYRKNEENRKWDTADGKKLSNDGGKQYIISDVKFSIFLKTSTITAYGPAPLLDEVGKQIDIIDIPQKQIYIEARIVEVSRSKSRSLGIEWGGHKLLVTDPNLSVTGGAEIGLVPSTQAGAVNSAISFPATAPTGSNALAAGINLSLGNALGTSKLNARLSALELEGYSKTLSNPKITTLNGITATIEAGREIPYQAFSGGSSGATTVEFKNASISLQVTPFVTPENRISMHIIASKDNADFNNQVLNVPTILTRRIETNVVVGDGGTAVLGGVFENSNGSNQQSVPGISKIPFFGALFKGSNKAEEEKELLIFISPRIVEN